jgi:hypothetical protein
VYLKLFKIDSGGKYKPLDGTLIGLRKRELMMFLSKGYQLIKGQIILGYGVK